MAPPFSGMTVTLDLSKDDCPALFYNNTMQVTINSRGLPNLRGHIIRQLISEKPILLLNYGRADTWYFSSEAFDVTMLHNTTKTYGQYKLSFANYDKARVDGTLRWVLPAINNDTLIKALRSFSIKEPTIQTIPLTNNRRITIYPEKPSHIPHYIKLNYKDKAIDILIAIPGRQQACQHCSSTQHWTNQCNQPHMKTPQQTIPTGENTTANNVCQKPHQ